MPDADAGVVNERSPLVRPNLADNNDIMDSVTATGTNGEVHMARDTEGHLETKSSWYLFLLTLSIGGLQIVWSVELSNGSPFLLSLGVNKALLAFVWIAGPLTGTLVQPYIGIRSDNCRISWGRRKPFMVFGGLATVVALLALAWVQETVGGFLWIFGVDPASTGTRTTIIVIATILMYCLDFAINTVQAGCRAFIVDNAPAHQQESANAWASRLTGVGNILGYIFGYINLPKIFPFLGYTQFQVLCALASFSLGITLLITCYAIQERDPRLDGPPSSENPGLVGFFKQVFKSIKHLPPRIAKVCEVQLAAWVGWFPFLFYSTTYIGQLYVNPIFEEHPDLSDGDINKAWEEATRIGTFALLVYAIISFVANIALPLFVVPTYRLGSTSDHTYTSIPEEEPSEEPRRRLSFSGIPSAEPPADIPDSKDIENEDGPTWLSKLRIPGLTLRRIWLLSHVLFAACMFSTFFIYHYEAATTVIALVGISWAVTLWAPFALISAEVAEIDAERRARRHEAEMAESSHAGAPVVDATNPESSMNDDDLESGSGSRDAKKVGEEENLAQAGIILGLHNVAVSAPQIFSSLVCSAIFDALQKPRGVPWDDSVGWVLRFGGCAALVAAWLTSRLGEGIRRVVS